SDGSRLVIGNNLTRGYCWYGMLDPFLFLLPSLPLRTIIWTCRSSRTPISDDGLHIRHPCFDAIKEELEELKQKVAEEANSRMNVGDKMKKMREDIKLLKELCIEVRNEVYKNDGLHSRHRCFHVIEEERLELKKEVAEDSKSRMKMEDELKEMREDIRLLKELCM
ncbi:hypothetical protein HID58_069759, partial [Brassica napus]